MLLGYGAGIICWLVLLPLPELEWLSVRLILRYQS